MESELTRLGLMLWLLDRGFAVAKDPLNGEATIKHGQLATLADALIAESAPRDGVAEGGEKGDGWVKCSERMPDAEKSVLVYAKHFVAQVGHFGKGYSDGVIWYGVSFHPTHWRPLPPPPKEGE